MNSAVITKVEYALNDSGVFTELDIIPHSGKISEANENTSAGILYTTQADFKMAKSSIETDSILKSISGRRAKYRITDANDVIYLVGSDICCANMTFVRTAEGNPGGFNGYQCQVVQKSTSGCELS